MTKTYRLMWALQLIRAHRRMATADVTDNGARRHFEIVNKAVAQLQVDGEFDV